MKKAILLGVILIFFTTACGMFGNGEPPLEDRILGKWSGALTNVNGDKVMATMEFFEEGTLVFTIISLNYSYGAAWSVDGNRINIVSEISPDDPTYRDVEFLTDDVVKMSKAELNVVETWTRVIE